ncbi:Myelin Expression Factor 2 [Manis pentadactyla]|nr:Myelin Expression Factor 2 [Manis pentadactyla]
MLSPHRITMDGQHSRFSLRQPRFLLCFQCRPPAWGAVSSHAEPTRVPCGTHITPWPQSKHSQTPSSSTSASGMTTVPFPIPLWQAPLSRAGND